MPKKSAKVSTPKLERVAQSAMHLGGQHLAEYSSARSRQDFTQPAPSASAAKPDESKA